MNAKLAFFFTTSVSARMGDAISIMFGIIHFSAETNILWHFFRIVVIALWTEPSDKFVYLALIEVGWVLFYPLFDTVEMERAKALLT